MLGINVVNLPIAVDSGRTKTNKQNDQKAVGFCFFKSKKSFAYLSRAGRKVQMSSIK